MGEERPETTDLLERAAEGDEAALGELLDRDRVRLNRMIRLRLDAKIRRRVDASDILQDVHLEASRRLPEYLRERRVPFYLWLRYLAEQRVAGAYRHHGAQKRDPRREVERLRDTLLRATSDALANQLVGSLTSPDHAAARAETREHVHATLESLDAMDREVLALRHFEQLSNQETAQALEIEPAAASKRYVRALARLGEALSGLDGSGS